MAPTKYGQNPSIEDVTKFLNHSGEDAEIVECHYGKPERSILVRHPKNVPGLHQMAKDFGQESAIHSKGGKHELHFYNGAMAGQVVGGEGTQFSEHQPEDNYTKIHTPEGPVFFTHNFDLGKSEKLTKPYVSEAQRRWAHTDSGKKALGGESGVHEWDEATRGKRLPEKIHKAAEGFSGIWRHPTDSELKREFIEDGDSFFNVEEGGHLGMSPQDYINHVKQHGKVVNISNEEAENFDPLTRDQVLSGHDGYKPSSDRIAQGLQSGEKLPAIVAIEYPQKDGTSRYTAVSGRHRSGHAMEAGHPLQVIAVPYPTKVQKSESLDKSKNVREQKKKVFGTNAAPPKDSDMQKKHISHIKDFAKKFLDLIIYPSGGKIDPKTGKRRDEDPEKGVDKPDWRSGHLEAQWNPDAIIHELAHLMLLPPGVGLEEGQKLMDKQYADVQRNYGYQKQKRSMGEVQPMAAEQLIRRHLGLPANKNSAPTRMLPHPTEKLKSGKAKQVPIYYKDDPARVAVEDPTNVIGTRVREIAATGKPAKWTDYYNEGKWTKEGVVRDEKWVDLLRQARFLTPENKQRMEDVFSKKIIFHPVQGWIPNPKNIPRRAMAEEPPATHNSPVYTSPVLPVSMVSHLHTEPSPVADPAKLAASEESYGEPLEKIKRGGGARETVESQPMKIKLMDKGPNKGRVVNVIDQNSDAFQVKPPSDEKPLKMQGSSGIPRTGAPGARARWDKSRPHKVIQEYKPGKPSRQGSLIAEAKDTHNFMTHSPEQKKLVHGVDLVNVKPSGEGWTGDVTVSGFGKNSKGEKVYVKGRMPKEIIHDREEDGGDPLGSEYEDLTTAQREGLYHNLANWMGMGKYVPTTAVVHDRTSSQSGPSGDHYSVMRLVPNATEYEEYNHQHQTTMNKLRDSGEIDKLALMNALLGNTDRHGSNYMMSPKGIHMIDHGLTFDWHGKSGRDIYLPRYYEHAYRQANMNPNGASEVHPEAIKWFQSLDPKQLQAYFKTHAKVPAHIEKPLLAALQTAQKVVKSKKNGMSMKDLRETITDALATEAETHTEMEQVMIQDGYYRYYKIDPETELKSRRGLFRIENGELTILEDPKKILKNLFEPGPVTKRTEDIMNSALHSPYFIISKDEDPELEEQYNRPIHDEQPSIEKEDSERAKIAGTVKLEALRNMLEKEEDDVELDVPDHLVVQNGSWRWS